MPLPSNDIRAQLAKLRSEFAERAALNSEYEREMASKYIHEMIPFEDWLAMRNAQQGKAEGGLAGFLKPSKVKERLYHGTGNLENLTAFDPATTGKGTDQLGSGFYLTNDPHEASGYAGQYHSHTGEKNPSPGVIPAHVAIRKPIKIGPDGMSLNDAKINLSHDQVKKIMGHAPNLHDPELSPLGNHVDTSRGVTPKMIHDIAKLYTGNALHALENDIFPEHPTEYRHALYEVTGHDGVVKDFGNGRKHYVAWFPHQIKSAIGNRGTYDPNDPDITKAHGGSIPSQDVMRLAIGGQGPKNWVKGSVEDVIKPLKTNSRAAENLEEMRRVYPPDVLANMSEETRASVDRAFPHLEKQIAINNWIDRNLANYIRKQMATHDDPIRKLAEQGIIHMPPEQMGYGSSQAEMVRKKHGAPRLGQSPEAQAWEDATDVAMHPHTIEEMQQGRKIGLPWVEHAFEPWMKDADPKTKIFRPTDNMHSHYLGFDHLVDILKEDLNQGRIRPEQLSKVSIEQAVRRAHEYDQERKKAMAETALKATEGMPVHKDYGNGFKWIELTKPKDLTELPQGHTAQPYKSQYSEGVKILNPKGEQVAAGDSLDEALKNMSETRLEEALKYEGDTMGHCVGGYCPDVIEGHSRIFSLRDAKNEPHVTIEVQPKKTAPRHEDVLAEMKKNFNLDLLSDEDYNISYEQTLNHLKNNPPLEIKQIKGKQNAKPKKDYIPYVQDFVKSGKWSDVGDIHNAEMIPIGEGKYVGESEAKKHFEPRIKKALDFLQNHPAFKEQHAAKAKRDKDLLDMDYEEQRKLESIYGQPVHPKSYYSASELLNVIKNPEENISSLNEYYPSLNSWLSEAEKGMAHHGYTPQQKAHGGITHAHHLEIEVRKPWN